MITFKTLDGAGYESDEAGHELDKETINNCKNSVENNRKIMWYDERKYKVGFLNILLEPSMIDTLGRYIIHYKHVPTPEILCAELQKRRAYYIGCCVDEELGLSNREEDRNEVCLARCYQCLGGFYKELDIMLNCHDWGCYVEKDIFKDTRKGIDIYVTPLGSKDRLAFDVRHDGKKSRWHQQQRKLGKVDPKENGYLLIANEYEIWEHLHFVPISQYKHLIDNAACPVAI